MWNVKQAIGAGFVCSVLLLPWIAHAQTGDDVGLVTLASGDITLTNSAGKAIKVRAFGHVRTGDRFTIGPGGSLRILYFQAGITELWQGPITFRAQNGISAPGFEPVETKSLPPNVQQALMRMTHFAHGTQFGGTTVRGLEVDKTAGLTAAKLKELRETYSRLRTTFPDEDIIPELFLAISVQEQINAALQ